MLIMFNFNHSITGTMRDGKMPAMRKNFYEIPFLGKPSVREYLHKGCPSLIGLLLH